MQPKPCYLFQEGCFSCQGAPGRLCSRPAEATCSQRHCHWSIESSAPLQSRLRMLRQRKDTTELFTAGPQFQGSCSAASARCAATEVGFLPGASCGKRERMTGPTSGSERGSWSILRCKRVWSNSRAQGSAESPRGRPPEAHTGRMLWRNVQGADLPCSVPVTPNVGLSSASYHSSARLRSPPRLGVCQYLSHAPKFLQRIFRVNTDPCNGQTLVPLN